MKNISIFGRGGEIILGSLNQSDIANWKKEKDLLQLAMLNNDVCHQSGVFIDESIEIETIIENNKKSYSIDDIWHDSYDQTWMDTMAEGFYSLYISEGRVSLEPKLTIKSSFDIDDILLVTHRFGQMDIIDDLNIDDIFICNKLTINDKKYDLEFDDSGLVSRLYIFQSLGNHIFEKIYSKDRWL